MFTTNVCIVVIGVAFVLTSCATSSQGAPTVASASTSASTSASEKRLFSLGSQDIYRSESYDTLPLFFQLKTRKDRPSENLEPPLPLAAPSTSWAMAQALEALPAVPSLELEPPPPPPPPEQNQPGIGQGTVPVVPSADHDSDEVYTYHDIAEERTDQSTDQSTELSTDQSTDQGTDQSTELSTELSTKQDLPIMICNVICYRFTKEGKLIRIIVDEVPEDVLYESTLTDDLSYDVIDEGDEVPEQVTNHVIDEGDEVPEQVTNQVVDEGDEMPEQVTNQDTDQVADQVTNQVTDQVADQVADQVTDQDTDKDTVQGTDKDTDPISNQIVDEVQDEIFEQDSAGNRSPWLYTIVDTRPQSEKQRLFQKWNKYSKKFYGEQYRSDEKDLAEIAAAAKEKLHWRLRRSAVSSDEDSYTGEYGSHSKATAGAGFLSPNSQDIYRSESFDTVPLFPVDFPDVPEVPFSYEMGDMMAARLGGYDPALAAHVALAAPVPGDGLSASIAGPAQGSFSSSSDSVDSNGNRHSEVHVGLTH